MTALHAPHHRALLKSTPSSHRLDMEGHLEIPIDEGYEDARSEITNFDESSRASLATSLTHYRYENGRRYHAYREGQYWAPNDEQATSVDAITHHIFLLTFNDKLFLAPLDKPRKVLDIGTGIGIWALDFAEKYPLANVIGTDLSPIQPDFAPPNVRFEMDDCCSEWVYPKDHFDYIHIRLLYASVADWPRLYREVYEHLSPGGYVEHAELSPVTKCDDGSIPPGSMWETQGDLAIECGEIFGKTMQIQPQIKGLITAAGFVDVVEYKFKWPLGPWSNDPRLKDIGRWNMHSWETGLEGWTMALLTRCKGWTYDEVKRWNVKMRQCLLDRKVHAYQDISVVVARKPQPK